MHGPEPKAAAAVAPSPRLRFSALINGWLLLLPAAVLLATFTHYPAVATIIDSFYSTPKARRAAVFVGADNYQAMLADSVFWRALSNNMVYAASVIPLTIALALAMALWVNGNIAGRPFLRLSFFTPTVLPMIAVAVWKDAGFFMIFYLAALQQMSPQLGEAAAIEGASRWYFFRRVTFPLLMPTTLFVLVNAIINAFRLIDHIVVMTQGGPDNSTALLLFYIYEVGFRFWDTAYAATLTVMLLVLLAALALGQFLILDRRVHYQ